jgi:copper chaperone CopZ
MSATTTEHGRVIAVSGMTCQGCVNAVTRVLSRVPGAKGVSVELEAGRAVVQGEASPDALLAAVRKAGYGAEFAPAG